MKLIERDAAQDDIRAIAVLSALGEHGQYPADVLHLPTGVVTDTAGPCVFAGAEAKQPGARMLAVYRHRLAFADDVHNQPRSLNETISVPPMTKWSSTWTSTSASACCSRVVILRSAGLGSGCPLG